MFSFYVMETLFQMRLIFLLTIIILCMVQTSKVGSAKSESLVFEDHYSQITVNLRSGKPDAVTAVRTP